MLEAPDEKRVHNVIQKVPLQFRVIYPLSSAYFFG